MPKTKIQLCADPPPGAQASPALRKHGAARAGLAGPLPFLVPALLLALCGCTSFSQVYHFQSAASGSDLPNFFRVKVEGDAQTVPGDDGECCKLPAGFRPRRRRDESGIMSAVHDPQLFGPGRPR